MNTKPDNTKLVEAMKQFKAIRTVIFQEEFYKAVVETIFYVPISVDKESAGTEKTGKLCALMTSDKKRFLSTYTSEEELMKSYGGREEVRCTLLNFPAIREIVTKKNSGLDGFIIDDKGENVAVMREEMLPKE
ncbi:MAG: SseB family protein [Clostridia bacterium]|nr:SseB family protein [Clostridia bacterium]